LGAFAAACGPVDEIDLALEYGAFYLAFVEADWQV
jgi:hypothetical protein